MDGDEKSEAKRQRVLIVDDDHEIVESVRFALEANGFEVLVARDGNQGLAMAEKEDPDLVVLDMMMPKRSGFLVLEKLRRTRPVPLRVIMITANEGSRHKAYAEMLGVDDYIRKPFAMDRLMDSVKRLLGLIVASDARRRFNCVVCTHSRRRRSTAEQQCVCRKCPDLHSHRREPARRGLASQPLGDK